MPEHRNHSPLDRARGHEVIWRNVSSLFNFAQPIVDCCFVYFIGEKDGPLKIGTAKDPISRLRQMQTGNPRPLRVEWVLVGDLMVERMFHALWEPFAIVREGNRHKPDAPPGTEWFKPEIRDGLFPIVRSAALEQISFIASTKRGEVVELTELQRIVREAHIAHEHVAKVSDEIKQLANPGYVTRRSGRAKN